MKGLRLLDRIEFVYLKERIQENYIKVSEKILVIALLCHKNLALNF